MKLGKVPLVATGFKKAANSWSRHAAMICAAGCGGLCDGSCPLPCSPWAETSLSSSLVLQENISDENEAKPEQLVKLRSSHQCF